MTVMYADFTSVELQEFRATSSRMLAEYGASLSSAFQARVSWWYGVGQNLAAAFIYSVFLATVLFVIKLSGSDALTILRALLADK
jgi:hypothetical protein